MINTLRADTTYSPTPEEFTSTDGFTLWQRTANGARLQEILADLLNARFLEPSKRPQSGMNVRPVSTTLPVEDTPIDVCFKVVQARGLLSKEGRSRDSYCSIEFSQSSEKSTSKSHSNNSQMFMTEVINGSNSPVWNQHLNLSDTRSSDTLSVSVWDRRKDYFLGLVKLKIGDLVSAAVVSGSKSNEEGGKAVVSGWYKLNPREGKHKDKYVGGEIYLELTYEKKVILLFSIYIPFAQKT